LLSLAQALGSPLLLAVYRVQDSQPALECIAWLAQEGFQGEPPAPILPLSELAHLNTAQVWSAGRRCLCGVQRWGRANGFQALASAPIGPPGALIGLALAAGGPTSQLDLLPGVAALLAASVETIFQSQAQIAARDERLAQDAQQRLTQKATEDHTREGLLLLAPDLSIAKINNAALQMLGYSAIEAANQPVEHVLIASESVTPALSAALAGSPTHGLDVRLYRRSGEEFPARVRIFPVGYGRQVIQVVVYIEDLQEREHIRQQTQQLEHRALLGEVTAVFAHEVRNPINNISTSLQLMAMNLPPDDANQPAIARMLQDCDRLAELIRSVLAFSKPTDYEMEALDMGQLLQRMLERLRPRLARAAVQMDFKAELDCAEVYGNARALEQVFANLVNNPRHGRSRRAAGRAHRAQL
jgi:PAS domain S-box-containing protein